MKAVIMAGGEGSRLRPITCTMPKPMVPLLNKPTIDYCVELLKKNGVTDITVTLHYLPDMIREHLKDGEAFGVNITYCVEERPLGTAGSVRAAAGDCDDTVIVVSGDAMTDINLREVMDAHKTRGAQATIVLKRVSVPTEYGVALLDAEKNITRFLEKPQMSEVFSDLANTGIYVLEPEVLKKIPEGVQYDFSKELFPAIMADGVKLHGYVAKGYWCDIGDIRQYAQAQRDMLDGKCGFSTEAMDCGGVFVEPNAGISHNTRTGKPCYIASDTQIGENTLIDEYSVICEGARIGNNCSIRRSIVMSGARIRDNAEIRGAVICPDTDIDCSAAIFENCVIGKGSAVGKNAVISPNVLVWPDKFIPDGEQCEYDVIWGEPKKVAIHDCGACGYLDGELTPESVLRFGAAFAKMIKPTNTSVIGCDGSIAGVMAKQAVSAGIMSQGVDVFDVANVSYAAFCFSIRNLGAAGGIYIHENGLSHSISVKCCGSDGTILTPDAARKLGSTYAHGEFIPLTSAQIGIIRQTTGMASAYEAELMRCADKGALWANPLKVLLNAPARSADETAAVLIKCGCSVLLSHAKRETEIYKQMTDKRADIYIKLDEAGNIEAASSKWGHMDENTISFLFALDRVDRGDADEFVLPVTMPRPYIEALREAGATVILSYENTERRKTEAYRKMHLMPEFIDVQAASVRLCSLISEGRAERFIKAAPRIYTKENKIGCSWRDVGRALRDIVEMENDGDMELVDGVRIKNDTGWVIVKPNEEFAACRVICGSYNQEYADELCDIYSNRLKRIIKKEEKKR